MTVSGSFSTKNKFGVDFVMITGYIVMSGYLKFAVG
jgi:hypothetical protein